MQDEYQFLDVVLEEEFHLSFPYAFRVGDDIFMIPETCANRDIRLYKSIDFLLKWKFERQLMRDVDAADTIVLRKMVCGLC